MKFFTVLRDYVIPQRCPICQLRVGTRGLCSDCWSNLNFISSPVCYQCGWPFPFYVGDTTLCSPCLAKNPPFKRHRSALIYTGEARKLIISFKHTSRESLIPLLGQWLLQAGRDIFPRVTYCLPVPLHWSRLIYRGFNQAAVLARYIAQQQGLCYMPRVLRRVRATPSQGGLDRQQRLTNLRTSDFQIKSGALPAGASVIIVDDVYTMGATLYACCQALKKSGIHDVYALTVARVLPQDTGSF